MIEPGDATFRGGHIRHLTSLLASLASGRSRSASGAMSGRAYRSIAAITCIVLAGATLPSPLYALWARHYQFGTATVTVIFATQALCSILTLLCLGRVSDLRGRRAVLFASLSLLIASSAIFYSAADVIMLVAARALSGIGVGLAQGTSAAAMLELEPHHDPYRASRTTMLAANGGLGTGPLVAGLAAQYGPTPTKLIFVIYGAALVLALILMAYIPETAPHRGRQVSLLPKMGWPISRRMLFAGAGAIAFSAFAMQSLFTALSSSFLNGTLHGGSPALAGAIIFLVFSVGTAGQLLSRGWKVRLLVSSGLGSVAVGLALIASGFAARNIVEFFAGAVVGGTGAGIALVGGLAIVNQLAPAHRRAELLSSYNLMAYTGVMLPVLGYGFLSEHVGATEAAVGFAALLFCVSVFAVITTAISGRNMSVGSAREEDLGHDD